MNTFPTLHDHAVLGPHCPHDPLAPNPTNARTVAHLRDAMECIESRRRVHQKLQLWVTPSDDRRVIESQVRSIVDEVLAASITPITVRERLLAQLRSAS